MKREKRKNRHSPRNKNACKRYVYRHLWRRRWDSNPRTGYPVNAFRVRPVMTTSIRLRSRYIIATFKRVSKTDLALHFISGFLALEVFHDGKTEVDGGAHSLTGDDVFADDCLGIPVKIGTV